MYKLKLIASEDCCCYIQELYQKKLQETFNKLFVTIKMLNYNISVIKTKTIVDHSLQHICLIAIYNKITGEIILDIEIKNLIISKKTLFTIDYPRLNFYKEDIKIEEFLKSIYNIYNNIIKNKSH